MTQLLTTKRASSAEEQATPPRYQQVADDLRAEIERGEWPVGGLLPTEIELCSHYAVSRSTVREALRRLGEAGLIYRRRRVGTEVIARTPPASYRQPTNSIADLLQYGDETRVEVLSTTRITCDAALAGLLECAPGQEWLRIHSLRTVPDDPRPICVTTTYVDSGLPDIGRELESVNGPISAMLERVYGIRIARIEQSIQAIRLANRFARLLRAEEGAPALRAVRRYYKDDGKLIEVSSAIHPADRFTYVTSLVRA